MKIANKELAIRRLEQELGFHPRTALAYIRSGGYCEYCGHGLIFDRLAYACAQIDHLLPRAKFREEITEMSQNYVLSCSLCNGIKRDYSVLSASEDAIQMLKRDRDILVSRAKFHIEEKLMEPNVSWNKAKEIFEMAGLN